MEVNKMKTAIRYFTKSKKGNTKKLADAVSKALGIEAFDVSRDFDEKIDRLFLIVLVIKVTIRFFRGFASKKTPLRRGCAASRTPTKLAKSLEGSSQGR